MKVSIFLFFSFFSFNLFAGTQMGKVGSLIVRASDGLIYFTIIGDGKLNGPSCAKNDYWMIKDENSEAGKKQYALLLAALAAQKTIRVSGMNTCIRWGDGEDVNYIIMGNE